MARQVVAAADDARLRQKRSEGLNPNAVVNIIRSVLGSAAVLPPNWEGGRNRAPLLALIKNRVSFLGVDEEDIERAALRAKQTWRLPVSVEWVVKRLDQLLAPEPEVSPDNGNEEVYTGR
jgi:hypothetical protein